MIGDPHAPLLTPLACGEGNFSDHASAQSRMRLPVKPANFQLSLLLALAAALAPVSSLLAQQSDPHWLALDASAPLPDPAPDDSRESMLPHFRDTRFWLSGQANFIFQSHPAIPRAITAARTASAPTTRKLPPA